MDKKALVRKYRGAVRFLCGVHNAPSRLAVRSRGKGNRVIAPCALLKHVKIRFNGSGNTVIVGIFPGWTMWNCISAAMTTWWKSAPGAPS